MRSKEIALWLDERWYAALSRQLEQKDTTVEDELNAYLDEMLNQLPAQVYERISREIWEEDQQRQQEMEAAKVFSAFHVREKGEEVYFQVEHSVELLDAARALRRYLRREPGASFFAELFRNREPITAEEFEQLAELRMENTGKVAGAFDLDFDRQEFSALRIMDGWKTWAMGDVSTAAYHAFRKDRLSPERRLDILLDRLEGREITPEVQLPEPADEPQPFIGPMM